MREHSDRDLVRMFALDDAPGPARPVDEARSATIIAGALGDAGFPPVDGGGGSGGAHGAGASSAAKGLAASKLTVLAGGAAVLAVAAATWLALRSPPPAGPAPAAVAVAPSPAPVAPPPPPSEPAAALPAQSSAPPSAQETRTPTAPTSPTKRPSPRPQHHRRAEPVVAAAATPEDLLADANAARAARRWRAADALYARVIAGGSADLAVQTALVASASLRLEHLGDPSGASQRFSAALASGPRDALAEDARWGLVESARALADTAGELRALDDFLAHHPGSPLAARARTRRAQLGAGP